MVLVSLKLFRSKVHVTLIVMINVNEIWMNGDWFYTAPNGNFGDGLITHSKAFTSKCVKKVSRSVQAYGYLVYTFSGLGKIKYHRYFNVCS